MMVCPYLRDWIALALATFALGLPTARADEPVAWLTDRSAAIAQARKTGKLLLVVHLSTDFTAADPLASNEAKLYRLAALADSRTAAAVKQRYVVLLRAVGESGAVRLNRKDKAAAQDCALTYICLPDERVLHFVPGFLSAADLLAELAWAERAYGNLAKLPPGEQSASLRQSHLATIARADLADFTRRFPSRWTGEELLGGESTVDLPAATAAARVVFEAALEKRLGPVWQRESQNGGLAALAAHGSIGGELAHLILAEFPLVALSDLARPAYAACSGRRMFSPVSSRRRTDLDAWWAVAANAHRPTLLVIADDDYFAATFKPVKETDVDVRPTKLRWPPDSPTEIPGLSGVATQLVTIDELNVLLTDARLPEVTYVRGQPLRFLLQDGSRFRVAMLTGYEVSNKQLAIAIAGLGQPRGAFTSATPSPRDDGDSGRSGTGASVRRIKK